MEENKFLKREHNPQEKANIEMVTEPPTGGTYTWIQGFIYPYKGLPHDFIVQILANLKKILPAVTVHFLNKKTIIFNYFSFTVEHCRLFLVSCVTPHKHPHIAGHGDFVLNC